jgi:hypothetical protein
MKDIKCPVVEEFQRIKNGGLTKKEIEEGYTIDPVLGRINLKKALEDRVRLTKEDNERYN